jgi:uncharacterized membrane protein
MICPHCSTEMPDISAFCPACGRSVNEHSPITSVPLLATNRREAFLGALAYVALLPAILFLALPSLRSSLFVRFHSWQSVFFAGSAVLVAALMRGVFAFFSLFPGIGFLFGVLAVGLVFLGLALLWMVLVIKAVQGQVYEIPWLGRAAAALTS